MIIGAMGDAHGGKYLGPEAASRLEGVDILLLAGDIADKNDIESYDRVFGLIRNAYQGTVVAVFGNDEYEQDHQRYRDRFDVVFLDDEVADLSIDGTKVRIVGTTGSLDRPTWWQRTHLPNIWKKYRDRTSRIKELLDRDEADLLVLLSHYVPTHLTLEGERERAFPEMGSRAVEAVLLEKAPDLVVHAHAHNGSRSAVLRKEQLTLDDLSGTGIPVWNVSLPLTKVPTRLELTKGERWHVRLQD